MHFGCGDELLPPGGCHRTITAPVISWDAPEHFDASFSKESCGGMAEWSMAVVLKTTAPGTVPGVRIPLPPPDLGVCLTQFISILKRPSF